MSGLVHLVCRGSKRHKPSGDSQLQRSEKLFQRMRTSFLFSDNQGVGVHVLRADKRE